MILLLILFCSLFWLNSTYAYKPINRFGHSAVLVNNSIYFYGGDTAVGTPADSPQWISDLAILPIDVPYALTRIPWKSSSGPQKTLGGPTVYSHVGFNGGHDDGNMILVGGVTPDNNLTDEATVAYTYNCGLGRWNTFNLPHNNYLNRQGSFATVVNKGQAYIWGGKRARHQSYNDTSAQLPSTMYRLDSINPFNSTTINSPLPDPPLRYSHTQTLVNGKLIVILGGFDGLTGDSLSLTDIWTFDTQTYHWNQVTATLDKDNKPANRSSHSEVLMSDGTSILIYGGYDGYHVFNDVAVLDTRTWTWTVKNTNAAVQGRADHTATLIGNNMIVAFGFTGVSTSLTVMSDIEVLDITTWSWTSYYVPSPGYPGNGDTHNINGGGNQFALPSTPSMAIVAGAVTGGLVVFVLIIVALYIFNFQQRQQQQQQQQEEQQQQHQNENETINDESTILSPSSTRHWDLFTHTISTPPISPISSISTPQPHLAATTGTATATTTAATTTTTTTTITINHQPRKRTNSLLPSPWKEYQPSHWIVKRALTTTGLPTTPDLSISKPDEPGGFEKATIIRRAVTTPLCISTKHNSSMEKIQDEGMEENGTMETDNKADTIAGDNDDDDDDNDDDDDDRFDRQEFILHSGEISSDQNTVGHLSLDEHSPH